MSHLKLVAAALAALVVLGGCMTAANAQPAAALVAKPSCANTQDARALTEAIDTWLAGRRHYLDAVMVQQCGELLYARTFNWFGADQPHEIQSATKTFSAILIGIAMDEGLIRSVDQPIAELLPEHAHLLTGDKAGITLYQVLTMQTGLRWTDFGEDNSFDRIEGAADSVAFVLEEPLESKPGERFFYSTGSSHLLAAIVQRQTGMTASEYAKTRLFGPLGISDVSWPSLQDGRTQGGWGMFLSPKDMVKVGQMLSDGGVSGGKQIVSSRHVDEMFKRRVETYYDAGYGYQVWFSNDHGSDSMGAARGYGGQDIFVDKELDLVVVFNGSIGEPGRNSNDIRLLMKEVILPGAVSR